MVDIEGDTKVAVSSPLLLSTVHQIYVIKQQASYISTNNKSIRDIMPV